MISCHAYPRLVFIVAFFIIMNIHPLTFQNSLAFIPLACIFMAPLGPDLGPRGFFGGSCKNCLNRTSHIFFLRVPYTVSYRINEPQDPYIRALF